jgi:hypothetical protein
MQSSSNMPLKVSKFKLVRKSENLVSSPHEILINDINHHVSIQPLNIEHTRNEDRTMQSDSCSAQFHQSMNSIFSFDGGIHVLMHNTCDSASTRIEHVSSDQFKPGSSVFHVDHSWLNFSNIDPSYKDHITDILHFNVSTNSAICLLEGDWNHFDISNDSVHMISYLHAFD